MKTQDFHNYIQLKGYPQKTPCIRKCSASSNVLSGLPVTSAKHLMSNKSDILLM